MQEKFILNHDFKINENIAFIQAEKSLKLLQSCSYPQHKKISEDKFLADIRIEKHETLEILTSIEMLDFTETGTFPVLVTINSKHTQQHVSKIIEITIFPAKPSYVRLENVYWRTYGLVIEGRLSSAILNSTRAQHSYYNMEIVDQNNKAVQSCLISLQNWYSYSKKDSFQVVFENHSLTSLDIGDYHFCVKGYESHRAEKDLYKVSKKSNVQFFSTRRTGEISIDSVDLRVHHGKEIQIFTTFMGETCLRIKKR